MNRILKTALAAMLIVAFCYADAYGQLAAKKKRTHSVRDSLRHAVLHRDSLMRSFRQSDGSINTLLQKIEYYNSQYSQDKSDFAHGFDTLDLSQKLPTLEKRMVVMGNLIQNDRASTLSYLFTIRDIMDHTSDQLGEWQDDLNADNNKLEKITDDIAEFKKDSALRIVPTDSLLRIKYFAQFGQVDKKWHKLDSCIKKSQIRIGELQNRVAALDITMLDVKDGIDQKIHDFSIKSLTNEYGFIWDMHVHGLSRLDTVWSKTVLLNSKLLKYFINPTATSHINLISHSVTLIILLAVFIWIISSKRRLIRIKEHHQGVFNQTKYIIAHPLIAALLIAATAALYVYDQPPFIFLELQYLIIMICGGILIKGVWSDSFFFLWKGLLALMFLFGITNLFIQVSAADRYFVFVLSCAAITIGYLFLQRTKKIKNDILPPHTCLIIKLFVLCQAISIFLNIMGRVSLAKIIGVSAVFNLCLGFGFFLFLQIIMECLFLQLEANKSANSNFISYIDFKELQNKFKSVLVKLAIIFWLVKLAENLDIDDFIFGAIGDFLNHPYKFSTTAFTFGSIVIFLVVMWLSVVLSRIISYFYDYAEQQSKSLKDVKKAKTSILLIRLSVYVVGFFAAIMFSGIPMDRITIIIGALGVGIGFGLQNIVNNLVSGVILAFEKPVQVGDIIEVGNRTGTIKEIGIRASKIETGNGSELIIPNGDLISQHVINWTLSNNNRQVELIVGVAYGSDIARVETLLKNLIRGRDDIMQTPPPSVFLHNFSDSSVDFKILFWAAEISTWVSLKSKIMAEIYTEFAKQGIEIPHPKRDIQVFFPDGTTAEIKTPDDVTVSKITPDDAAPDKALPRAAAPKKNPPGQAG